MSRRRDAEDLLTELLADGAIPVIERQRLQITAPPGVLTDERRAAIEAVLPELRAIVAARWRPREKCMARRPCRRMSRCAEPADGRPCLMPATCCLCGAALEPGRLYLCPACADAGLRVAEAARASRHGSSS
jgi:hypothetical protein